MNHRLQAALLLLLPLIAVPAHAQDWAHARGPNGTGIGIAPGVPPRFVDKDLNWKITLPGAGHSSPVLWGDRLFITCCDLQTATRMVLCIKASDGSILWRRDFPSHPSPLNPENSYATATPAVDEKNVYVSWSTPEEYSIIALDHDGKDAWKCNLGRYQTQHGNSGISPIVVGDVVLVGDDQEGPHSSILGIDRNTGKTLWERDRTAPAQGGQSASTPVLLKNSDGSEQAVFVSRYHGISGIDPKTGDLKWEMKDAFKYRTVGSPVVVEDLVVAFSGEQTRGHEFYAVKADGGKVTTAYSFKDFTPYVPGPMYVNKLLFLLNDIGKITCVEGTTGKKIWETALTRPYFSSLVCTGDKIYAISKKGDVTCFAAKATFENLGESKLGELCQSTPAISGGKMYIRTYTHLMSVGK